MIINDVLDMSKIEAGKLNLVEGDVLLMPFLENIIDSFAYAARKKSLSLSLVADPSQLPKAIIADGLRLRQIIFNFMSNAMKFTARGYCQLKAAAVPIAGSRYRITIDVEDSGLGIPKEKQSEIFVAFRQIEDHLQHESGTGLGLSISKQLVALMGGTLHLESPVNPQPAAGEGFGSRFTVTFEAEAVAHAASPAPLTDKKKIHYAADQGLEEPLKILVVDDNRSNRLVLREILEPIGFAVTEAEDGSQVIDKCLQDIPDLILMDLRMPEMDGFSAFEQLSFHEQMKHIPVIAITASTYDTGAIRKRCLRHGFRDFIQKPFEIDDLLHKLAGLLPIALACEGGGNAQEEKSIDLVPPPAEELAKLKKLLAEGDLDSIADAADAIAVLEAGKYAQYCSLLKQYVEDFDFAKLDEMIAPEDNQ